MPRFNTIPSHNPNQVSPDRVMEYMRRLGSDNSPARSPEHSSELEDWQQRRENSSRDLGALAAQQLAILRRGPDIDMRHAE